MTLGRAEVIKKDSRLREMYFGALESVKVDMSFYEREVFFTMFEKTKFIRDDIETPRSIEDRLWSAFGEFETGKVSLGFTHFGVQRHVIRKLGYDFYLNNCGVVAFTADEKGLPQELHGYWNNFESGL